MDFAAQEIGWCRVGAVSLWGAGPNCHVRRVEAEYPTASTIHSNLGAPLERPLGPLIGLGACFCGGSRIAD